MERKAAVILLAVVLGIAAYSLFAGSTKTGTREPTPDPTPVVYVDPVEGDTFYRNIGHRVETKAYINNTEINTPVYYNTTALAIQGGDPSQYFVELIPVFEAIGAEAELAAPNKINVKYGDQKYTFDASYVYENETEQSYKTGIENCYIVNGTAYIEFALIRYEIDGSLNEDDNSIYLYTRDFVRTDIPATLDEAYQYFDETLSDEDKEFLKNCTEDELASLHFGMGLGIRNRWIHPTSDRIARVFLEKGITHPDDMSAGIIRGYKLYLNGRPCEIDDIIQAHDRK